MIWCVERRSPADEEHALQSYGDRGRTSAVVRSGRQTAAARLVIDVMLPGISGIDLLRGIAIFGLHYVMPGDDSDTEYGK